MDFNLKHWREEQQESKQEHQQTSAKIPRQHPLLESPHQEAAAFPLFVSSEPQNVKITTTHFPSYPDHSSTPTSIPSSSPRFPKVGGGYCFSIGQWQELELQALIFRHMIAGAAVPPELLQLVKKSLLTFSASSYHLHHYSPHFHQASLLRGVYWGKGAVDPEPGRCRRTDGKKWRCSRDVMAGLKYCVRHVHRGRNRSRKPVEFASSTSASGGGNSGCAGPLNRLFATAFATGSSGGATPFSLCRSGASSFNAFQLNQESSSELSNQQQQSVGGEKHNSNRVLMHFFDDWPRSLQRSNNSESDGGGNPSLTTLLTFKTRNWTSDFLRLSTGNGVEVVQGKNVNEDRQSGLGWSGGGWGVNQMGGPLGEALRSSTTNYSRSVLHQLPRCSAPDTSYVIA